MNCLHCRRGCEGQVRLPFVATTAVTMLGVSSPQVVPVQDRMLSGRAFLHVLQELSYNIHKETPSNQTQVQMDVESGVVIERKGDLWGVTRALNEIVIHVMDPKNINKRCGFGEMEDQSLGLTASS